MNQGNTLLTRSNRFRLLSTCAFLFVASVSPAQAATDYNFVQLNAVQVDYQNIKGVDFRGAEFRGSKSWRSLFGEVRYRKTADSVGNVDFDETNWNVTAGYFRPLSEKVHFDVRLNYGDAEIEGRDNITTIKNSSDRYSLSSFLHYSVDQNIDLYAGLEWQKWEEGADQKAYQLGALYRFELVSAGVEYVKYSDIQTFNLFVRYSL